MLKPLIICLIIFLFISCCRDNSVKQPPAQDDNLCVVTDSTSHDITWRVDTIGVFPSVLYDVAAINPNNVWAVGEIELKEHPDTDRFNAVNWNGTGYEYYKIDTGSGAPRLDVVMGFNKNDIWFFGVGGYHHWNGDSFITNEFEMGDVRGVPRGAWGVSSEDYYIVGDNGTISHYDGNNFTLIESNTDIDLFDIKGYVDAKTGEKHIWVLGFESDTSVVLEYKNGQWNDIWDMDMLGNYHFPHTLYIPDNKSIIISVWSGRDQKGRLYCFDQNDLTKYKLLAEHSTFDYSMVAQSINDIYITGSLNSIEHFNGKSFKKYTEVLGASRNYQIDIADNRVFAVGGVYQLGLFMHGEK